MSNFFPVTHSTLSPRAIEAEVLPNYELAPPVQCVLLNRGLNDTYVVKAGSSRYVMRAYRYGLRSLPAVLYELDALRHLHARRVAVPAPVPRRDGVLINRAAAPEGERLLVLFSFVPGKPPVFDEAASFEYGRLVAQIHHATSSFNSRHARFHMDLEYLLNDPLESLRPQLAHRPADWDYLARLAERLHIDVLDLPVDELDYGFCHGDVNWMNIHAAADGTLTMLDFDCCAVGWRAFDLATFRFVSRIHDREGTTWPAFLRGYEAVRSLGAADIQGIETFVPVRALWALGLHAFAHQRLGFAKAQNRFCDYTLGFLRKWEADHPRKICLRLRFWNPAASGGGSPSSVGP